MLRAALCRKMNPIGIAFGPGVADIRLRGSQRVEEGRKDEWKSGERITSRIYFESFDK